MNSKDLYSKIVENYLLKESDDKKEAHATHKQWRDVNKKKVRNQNERKRKTKKGKEQAGARDAVRRAVEQGILTKPKTCPKCHKSTDSGDIIFDHNKKWTKDCALKGEWMCRECHNKKDNLRPGEGGGHKMKPTRGDKPKSARELKTRKESLDRVIESTLKGLLSEARPGPAQEPSEGETPEEFQQRMYTVYGGSPELAKHAKKLGIQHAALEFPTEREQIAPGEPVPHEKFTRGYKPRPWHLGGESLAQNRPLHSKGGKTKRRVLGRRILPKPRVDNTPELYYRPHPEYYDTKIDSRVYEVVDFTDSNNYGFNALFAKLRIPKKYTINYYSHPYGHKYPASEKKYEFLLANNFTIQGDEIGVDEKTKAHFYLKNGAIITGDSYSSKSEIHRIRDFSKDIDVDVEHETFLEGHIIGTKNTKDGVIILFNNLASQLASSQKEGKPQGVMDIVEIKTWETLNPKDTTRYTSQYEKLFKQHPTAGEISIKGAPSVQLYKWGHPSHNMPESIQELKTTVSPEGELETVPKYPTTRTIGTLQGAALDPWEVRIRRSKAMDMVRERDDDIKKEADDEVKQWHQDAEEIFERKMERGDRFNKLVNDYVTKQYENFTSSRRNELFGTFWTYLSREEIEPEEEEEKEEASEIKHAPRNPIHEVIRNNRETSMRYEGLEQIWTVNDATIVDCGNMSLNDARHIMPGYRPADGYGWGKSDESGDYGPLVPYTAYIPNSMVDTRYFEDIPEKKKSDIWLKKYEEEEEEEKKESKARRPEMNTEMNYIIEITLPESTPEKPKKKTIKIPGNMIVSTEHGAVDDYIADVYELLEEYNFGDEYKMQEEEAIDSWQDRLSIRKLDIGKYALTNYHFYEEKGEEWPALKPEAVKSNPDRVDIIIPKNVRMIDTCDMKGSIIKASPYKWRPKLAPSTDYDRRTGMLKPTTIVDKGASKPTKAFGKGLSGQQYFDNIISVHIDHLSEDPAVKKSAMDNSFALQWNDEERGKRLREQTRYKMVIQKAVALADGNGFNWNAVGEIVEPELIERLDLEKSTSDVNPNDVKNHFIAIADEHYSEMEVEDKPGYIELLHKKASEFYNDSIMLGITETMGRIRLKCKTCRGSRYAKLISKQVSTPEFRGARPSTKIKMGMEHELVPASSDEFESAVEKRGRYRFTKKGDMIQKCPGCGGTGMDETKKAGMMLTAGDDVTYLDMQQINDILSGTVKVYERPHEFKDVVAFPQEGFWKGTGENKEKIMKILANKVYGTMRKKYKLFLKKNPRASKIVPVDTNNRLIIPDAIHDTSLRTAWKTIEAAGQKSGLSIRLFSGLPIPDEDEKAIANLFNLYKSYFTIVFRPHPVTDNKNILLAHTKAMMPPTLRKNVRKFLPEKAAAAFFEVLGNISHRYLMGDEFEGIEKLDIRDDISNPVININTADKKIRSFEILPRAVDIRQLEEDMEAGIKIYVPAREHYQTYATRQYAKLAATVCSDEERERMPAIYSTLEGMYKASFSGMSEEGQNRYMSQLSIQDQNKLEKFIKEMGKRISGEKSQLIYDFDLDPWAIKGILEVKRVEVKRAEVYGGSSEDLLARKIAKLRNEPIGLRDIKSVHYDMDVGIYGSYLDPPKKVGRLLKLAKAYIAARTHGAFPEDMPEDEALKEFLTDNTLIAEWLPRTYMLKTGLEYAAKETGKLIPNDVMMIVNNTATGKEITFHVDESTLFSYAREVEPPKTLAPEESEEIGETELKGLEEPTTPEEKPTLEYVSYSNRELIESKMRNISQISHIITHDTDIPRDLSVNPEDIARFIED